MNKQQRGGEIESSGKLNVVCLFMYSGWLFGWLAIIKVAFKITG